MNRHRKLKSVDRDRWSLGAGALVAFCALLAGCAESAESPEVLVERGHLMESRGKLDEAIEAYTKALKARPNEATIYFDRGVACGRSGRLNDAVADYTRAIEHDPALAKAYNNRAAAYAQQRKFQPAVVDFTKAISLDSKSALAYRNRGLAYHDLGDLNQAIEDFTTAIRLDPTAPDSQFERGNAYLEAGEYRKAIADYDRSLAIDPTRGPAWLNRGECYRRLGDMARAQADFEKAKQISPTLVPEEVAQSSPSAERTSPAVQESSTDAKSRRSQAVRVAADFLQAKGFGVRPAPAFASFELLCDKGPKRFNVVVEALGDGQSRLRLTKEEIDLAGQHGVTTALVVVGKFTAPKSAGQPYAGGTVLKFVEDWKPLPEKLVPVVFEYPLP